MKMNNDCERDYIKEAFDKLYNCVIPYIDLTQFSDADTAFKELDKKVHSEIYILKKCLAESDRAVYAGITRSKVLQERISYLEKQLAQENQRLKLLENSRTGWRSRAQHAEKRVMDLNEKIHDLEEENTNLRVPPDDANAIEVLRGENEVLWSRVEEVEKENRELKTHNEALENVISALKRRNEMLYSKIEELNAKKARLEENVDLSYGHEFEFGDEVFVPWSCGPYMYVKSGMMYNLRTERLVYVGKDQHLKWFGEKFSIV